MLSYEIQQLYPILLMVAAGLGVLSFFKPNGLMWIAGVAVLHLVAALIKGRYFEITLDGKPISTGWWQTLCRNIEVILAIIVFWGVAAATNVGVHAIGAERDENSEKIARIQAQASPEVLVRGEKMLVTSFDGPAGTAIVTKDRNKPGISVPLAEVQTLGNYSAVRRR